MAQDIIKPRGALKSTKPDAGGAVTKSVPILGIVKDNIDPTRQGRLKVYLSEPSSTTNPDDKDNWVTVSFLSPFFGKTSSDGGNDTYGSYKANPSSYGMWNSPPDIGTTVVCVFINGDLNFGFYIGCVPEPEALQMVPAIGATDNIVANEGEAQSYGGALRLPVTNINTNNKGIADSSDYLTAAKPIHSYSAAIMTQQGVIRDPLRGPISSSSQRETPSRVGWGVSTPGRPIYDGGFDDVTIAQNLEANKAQQLRIVSRRGGHSIVMDDGDVIGRDNLIRIRTSLGHQILMSDDGQTLMLLHSNGQSYIELGKEGTVDVYSMNSVNVRTHGDLNLHADQNVNIHAKKDFNVQAENIHFVSEKDFKQKVGADHQTYTTGKHTIKVDGAYSVESGGDASMASGGIAYVNGSKVNLNTGKTSTTPQTVKQIPITAHTDTLHDEAKGWLAAPAKLLSITSRAPAHAPWLNAGQGIDVKVDSSAGSQLPQSASAPVESTNQAAASAASTPTQGSTVSSSPPVQATSAAIDKNTTGALLGQMATDASKGPLATAQTSGTAVAPTANGVQVGIGQFASTPQQLETAGTIKQGSAPLVDALAAKTGNATQALQQNLFTGQSGAQNATQLINNVTAQANVAVSTLQKAQTQLTQAGVMTGKEAAQQVAGMVYAGATQGVDKVIGTVRSIGSTVSGLTSNIQGQANAVTSAIGSGNFAAGVAQNVTGALAGVQASAEAAAKSLDLAAIESQAKGAAAAAFSSIAASMKPLQAGIPQNLTEIAQKTASEAVATAESIASTTGQSLAGAQNAIADATQAATSAATTAAQNAIQSGTGSITTTLKSSTSIASAIEKTANVVVSTATTAATKLVSSVVTGATSNASNIISQAQRAAGYASPGTTGTDASNIIAQAQKTAGYASPGTTSANVISQTQQAGGYASASSLVQTSTAKADNLVDAAVAQATGALSSTATTIASGISNLPGGQQAVNAVVDTVSGAINDKLGSIGKLTGLGDAINGATTDALNSLAKGKLPDLNSLASKALAGLPAGVSSALQGAISSLSAGGQVPIKLPTVATSTINRESLTAQVKSVLGDPGIPTPNLGGEIPDSAKTDLQKREAYSKDLRKAVKEQDKLLKKANKAEKEYRKLLATLPQGDPAIEKAQQAWVAILTGPEAQAVAKKYNELREQGKQYT